MKLFAYAFFESTCIPRLATDAANMNKDALSCIDSQKIERDRCRHAVVNIINILRS